MLRVDDLSPYEKGVVARWLLGELIGQARIEEESSDTLDISVGVPSWQLKLLAQFCGNDEDDRRVEQETRDLHTELSEILS